MTISQEQLEQLNDVNVEVNNIPYDAIPKAGEGNDVWKDKPDDGTWVCRDYVLVKAERLAALGWSRNLMSVILCYVETGEYHGVLGIADNGDTWILDSRVANVYSMARPPLAYRWDKRQIVGTTGFEQIV